MTGKPTHLSGEYATWFGDQLIVDAYAYRPPYPAEAIEHLVGLADHGVRTVLDIGCGIGDLARRLAPHLSRVDAVDISEAMITHGRELAGGDHPRLRWFCGAGENVALDPPYTLVTAGESLHWMDWDVVLPRLARALVPDGVLAIVTRDWGGPPALRSRLSALFARYSPVRDFQDYDLVALLEDRGLFTPAGAGRFGPEAWRPTVEEYIEGRHSQSGGSRTHMGDADAAAFDQELRDALSELVKAGEISMVGDRLEFEVEAHIVWGTPHLRHR
jgi:SAM-dependent methyltransferase